MDVLANIFSGLGLFFIGIKILGGGMRQLSSRKFRELVARTTQNPVSTALVGTLAGAITQSSSAVTFIIVSLVTGDLIKVQRATPLLAWANVGTSLLVFLATIDIHLITLYLIGVVGFSHFLKLDENDRVRHLLVISLGISLMFLGLWLIKQGAAPLKDDEMVREFLVFASSSLFWPFLGGFAATLIIQSSSTLSAIAVTMTSCGLLTFDQTMMILLGSNFGSGVATYLMAGNLSGVGKQIALSQMFVKGIGSLMLLPIVLAEIHLGTPGIKFVIEPFASDASHEIALAYLILQVGSVLAFLPTAGAINWITERLAPPHPSDSLSKPQYLFDQAIEDAETGLDLVEKEQARLFGYLSRYFDVLRPDEVEGALQDAQILSKATRQVSEAIEQFIDRMMIVGAPHTAETMERFTRIRGRQELIHHLSDGCLSLQDKLREDFKEAVGNQLRQNLVESLCTILIVVEDLGIRPTESDCDFAKILTSDRNEVMRKIREKLVDSESQVGLEAQLRLLPATSLFERLVWLSHQFLLTLGSEREAEEVSLEAEAA